MPDQLLGESALAAAGETQAEAEMEDKRRHNREFMRRWRTDPVHLARERANRRARYYDGQKQRRIERVARSPQARAHDEKLCGFCWKRAAVKKIVRLQVSESAPDGYVKVRMPYCGQC